MFNKEMVTWSRWASEFLVVVVGVLVALAVDNYRENLDNRDRQDTYLANLLIDVEGDQQQLLGSINQSRRSLSQIESLLLVAGIDLNGLVVAEQITEHGYNREGLGESTTVALLNDKYYTWIAGRFDTFDPYQPTYASLLATGDLRLIENEDLKRSITYYYENIRGRNSDRPDMINDVHQLNEFLASSGINTYDKEHIQSIPFLEGSVPYLAAARNSQHWWYARKLLMLESMEALLIDLHEVVGDD